MNKNEMNSKSQRAQGGKGLLSRSISVQKPQESMPLNPREEREEERKREGAREKDVAALFLWLARGRKRRG